jgi:hypothetical protein
MSRHASRIARDQAQASERIDTPIRGGRAHSRSHGPRGVSVDEQALRRLTVPGEPCDLGAGVAGDSDTGVTALWPFAAASDRIDRGRAATLSDRRRGAFGAVGISVPRDSRQRPRAS